MLRPSPRALRRLAPLWLIAPIVLLLTLWTWTESAAITLNVAGGRCTAVLYGRSSTIDCPGLPGGRLSAFIDDNPTTANRALARLWPPSAWIDIDLLAEDKTAFAADPLPATFQVTAILRRPIQPAGLLLLRPDGRTGWVFIIDAANRRGAWWQWADGATTPLRGIPLDRPFAEQAKPFVRQLLAGWPAAAALAALVALLASLSRRVTAHRPTTYDQRPTTRSTSEAADSALATRAASEAAHSAFITRHSPLATCYLSLVACLLAFALALHVSVDVLERLPHIQDSVTYLFQAQTLARGALTAPAPPLAAAEATAHFEQEFLLVRDGRWFGKYPPGWPALLALGVLVDAPWLVNPLLAAVSVALLLQLGIRNYELGIQRQHTTHRSPLTTDLLITALLTTVLLSTSPFFLVMSGSLMAHPAELLWTLLLMVAWRRALLDGLANRSTRRWAIVAGLALGALFLTRQFTALTIGAVLGASHFLKCVAPSGPSTGKRRKERATHFRKCIARGALVLLVAAPLVLALPLYQAAVTGDARADPRLLYWPYDRVGFGPGVGEPENAFTMSPTDAGPAITWYTDPAQPPRGHSPARGLYNLGRNLEALQASLFGWPPALTLAFVWLAFLLRRPAIFDWLLLLVIVAVSGGYVAYWASGIAYGPRYFYAALPALVILTARGATALAAYGRGQQQSPHPQMWTDAVSRGASEAAPSADGRQWAVAFILLLLVGYNLVTLPGRIDNYRGYNFVSAEGRRTVEASVETPALVFVTASEADWWEYGAFFSGNTPWLDGPVVYARDLDQDENARLRAAFPDRHIYWWTGTRLLVIEDE